MFGKIQYKLLIETYMTKVEYKKLIEEYMNRFSISYISAIQIIIDEQINKFEKDFNISYSKAFIQTYNDMNYNISMV